jgi:hypothetical protein
METQAQGAISSGRACKGAAFSLQAGGDVTDPNQPEASQVYVRRDAAGDIVSMSRVPVDDHPEACPADRIEVVAFLKLLSPRNAALLESDLSLIRALEDLIDVLIQKDVLRLTDLPVSVQTKLLSRRRLRSSLRSLSLLGSDGDVL